MSSYLPNKALNLTIRSGRYTCTTSEFSIWSTKRRMLRVINWHHLIQWVFH